MICFRDTTYCGSPNCRGVCGRRWTPELQAEAERWWGGPDAPVAFGYFCGGPADDDSNSLDDRVRD